MIKPFRGFRTTALRLLRVSEERVEKAWKLTPWWERLLLHLLQFIINLESFRHRLGLLLLMMMVILWVLRWTIRRASFCPNRLRPLHGVTWRGRSRLLSIVVMRRFGIRRRKPSRPKAGLGRAGAWVWIGIWKHKCIRNLVFLHRMISCVKGHGHDLFLQDLCFLSACFVDGTVDGLE